MYSRKYIRSVAPSAPPSGGERKVPLPPDYTGTAFADADTLWQSRREDYPEAFIPERAAWDAEPFHKNPNTDPPSLAEPPAPPDEGEYAAEEEAQIITPADLSEEYAESEEADSPSPMSPPTDAPAPGRSPGSCPVSDSFVDECPGNDGSADGYPFNGGSPGSCPVSNTSSVGCPAKGDSADRTPPNGRASDSPLLTAELLRSLTLEDLMLYWILLMLLTCKEEEQVYLLLGLLLINR